MPHPQLSLRNGPFQLQSALLLGRSFNNRLVIGGVLQLELTVTMISDTLTSLSSETGMYTAMYEMLTISSLLIGTPACSPPFVFLTLSRWPARTIMYQHLPKSRMAPQEKNQKKRKSIRRQEKVNLRRRPGTTRTPAEITQLQKAKGPE